MNDITRPLGATQPVCLRQSQHRTLSGRPILRVDVEGAQMPTLIDVTIGEGVTRMGGAILPERVYLAHLGIGWSLKLKPTANGVRVELHDVRTKGALMCPDYVWRWATLRVVVEQPWWPAVQSCEWAAGEAGEVVA